MKRIGEGMDMLDHTCDPNSMGNITYDLDPDRLTNQAWLLTRSGRKYLFQRDPLKASIHRLVNRSEMPTEEFLEYDECGEGGIGKQFDIDASVAIMDFIGIY